MYNKSRLLNAFSLIEIIIALSASAILISTGFLIILQSFSVIKSIREESSAISDAVVFFQRLDDELKGRIITKSVSLTSGTAELSFKSDYNDDSVYENIEYYLNNDTLEKSIDSVRYSLRKNSSGSFFTGETSFITAEIIFHNSSGVELIRLRTGIFPR